MPSWTATGHYDDFEVERVVQVELNPKATQAQLAATIEARGRTGLLKRFKAASEAFKAAAEKLPGGEAGPLMGKPPKMSWKP